MGENMGVMNRYFFDPYLTFRIALALAFFTYFLFDLIGIVVFYRQLPRFIQRVVFLKLLQVRSRSLRLELSLIVVLSTLEGWLLLHLLTGGN